MIVNREVPYFQRKYLNFEFNFLKILVIKCLISFNFMFSYN